MVHGRDYFAATLVKPRSGTLNKSPGGVSCPFHTEEES